ncbi:MAG: ABC transporter permease [Caldilineales bacterium]|nr:ABC transporter permease [Caldilineales bacterium]
MSMYFELAWRNMWRNWRRTSIALVAIILGLVLLLFMNAFIVGSDQAIFGNAVRLYGGNIQVHAPGFREKATRFPLTPLNNPDQVVEAAESHPHVLAAAKRISTAGFVSNREGAYPVSITGIEPTVEAPLSIQAENVTEGRFLAADEGDALFIGQGLADALDAKVGDRVTVTGRSKNETMRQRTMTIVGIYDLGMPDIEKGMAFITLPEAQSLYNLRDDATEVTMILQSIGQEKAVIASLAPQLPGAELDTWDDLRPEFRETMSTKAAFSSFFGIIVIMIASIGILNLMLMAVFERTREMGVLAALGLKGRQIMSLFLLEGTMIGLVGAIIGCLLGGLLVFWFSRVGIDFSFASGMGEITALMGDRLYPMLTLSDIITRGLLVVIIAALASLYPAWQASRKEPAESLHHV